MRPGARASTLSLGFFGVLGCQATSSPTPPPVQPSPVEAPELPPPPPPVPAPPAAVDYRTALAAALKQTFQGNAIDVASPDFVVFRQRGRKKRDVVVTSGLGRAVRSEGDPRIELVAHVPVFGEGVGEVLQALGRRVDKLEMYEVVELEPPIRGMQHFDLLSGGEVTVLGERVRLYRVVPLTPEEFERAAETQGSQWVGGEKADPDAAARALERWAPVLKGRKP